MCSSILYPSDFCFVDTVDGDEQVLEDADSGKLASCVFVDSRDHLEVSLTPHIMTSVYNLVSEYLNKPAVPQPIVSCASHTAQEIELINEIGPNSKITVLAQDEVSIIIYSSLV